MSGGGHGQVLLELCVAGPDDAAAAAAAGADRLELCSALQLGGLTPTLGTLAAARAAAPALPVVALVRPRGGGCVYTPREFAVLADDLEALLDAGADAAAVGVLQEDGAVDEARCAVLIRRAAGRPLVFHRAFDLAGDPFAALETLARLGFRRILTSGQQPTALAGAALLRRLVQVSAGRVELLPAGGIRADNVAAVVAATGCRQVHAGPRRWAGPAEGSAVRFGPADGPGHDRLDEAAAVSLRAQLATIPPP